MGIELWIFEVGIFCAFSLVVGVTLLIISMLVAKYTDIPVSGTFNDKLAAILPYGTWLFFPGAWILLWLGNSEEKPIELIAMFLFLGSGGYYGLTKLLAWDLRRRAKSR